MDKSFFKNMKVAKREEIYDIPEINEKIIGHKGKYTSNVWPLFRNMKIVNKNGEYTIAVDIYYGRENHSVQTFEIKLTDDYIPYIEVGDTPDFKRYLDEAPNYYADFCANWTNGYPIIETDMDGYVNYNKSVFNFKGKCVGAITSDEYFNSTNPYLISPTAKGLAILLKYVKENKREIGERIKRPGYIEVSMMAGEIRDQLDAFLKGRGNKTTLINLLDEYNVRILDEYGMTMNVIELDLSELEKHYYKKQSQPGEE